MRPVSRNEFYERCGPLNVHPSIITDKWPYTSIWKLPNRDVFGKSVGKPDGTSEYFINDPR
jgi:hypothetical protein